MRRCKEAPTPPCTAARDSLIAYRVVIDRGRWRRGDGRGRSLERRAARGPGRDDRPFGSRPERRDGPVCRRQHAADHEQWRERDVLGGSIADVAMNSGGRFELGGDGHAPTNGSGNVVDISGGSIASSVTPTACGVSTARRRDRRKFHRLRGRVQRHVDRRHRRGLDRSRARRDARHPRTRLRRGRRAVASGPLPVATGRLTGVLQSGEAVDNVFYHLGAVPGSRPISPARSSRPSRLRIGLGAAALGALAALRAPRRRRHRKRRVRLRSRHREREIFTRREQRRAARAGRDGRRRSTVSPYESSPSTRPRRSRRVTHSCDRSRLRSPSPRPCCRRPRRAESIARPRRRPSTPPSLARIAQVWLRPALIARAVPPAPSTDAGTPSCPSASSPQHTTPLVALTIAQACRRPTAIARAVPPVPSTDEGGVDSPAACEPQRRRPGVDRAAVIAARRDRAGGLERRRRSARTRCSPSRRDCGPDTGRTRDRTGVERRRPRRRGRIQTAEESPDRTSRRPQVISSVEGSIAQACARPAAIASEPSPTSGPFKRNGRHDPQQCTPPVSACGQTRRRRRPRSPRPIPTLPVYAAGGMRLGHGQQTTAWFSARIAHHPVSDQPLRQRSSTPSRRSRRSTAALNVPEVPALDAAVVVSDRADTVETGRLRPSARGRRCRSRKAVASRWPRPGARRRPCRRGSRSCDCRRRRWRPRCRSSVDAARRRRLAGAVRARRTTAPLGSAIAHVRFPRPRCGPCPRHPSTDGGTALIPLVWPQHTTPCVSAWIAQ